MTCTLSNVVTRARSAVRWAAVLAIPLTAACGAFAANQTACDGLVYKEGGLTRAEYLPQIDKMIDGDASARSDASAIVGELRTLLNKAGGRNLLERWNDRALTSLNVSISNAVGQHEACMMVAGQLFGRAPLGDEKNREPARSQCRAYRRAYEEASREYRRLR
jgi:hypothetical protein